MREIVIEKNDAGQRLDKFLSKALPSLPASKLYKSIRLKKIKVNRRRAEISQILNVGDTLQLFLSEDFFKDGRSDKTADILRSIRTNLDIIYEDENILLINKRPGVSVHEDENGEGSTLILHIQAYLFSKGEYNPEKEASFAPALCNRIDRNTGGIVIAAKNAEALRVMNEKIKERKIDKFYLCAVHGMPSPKEATLSAFLLKDSRENTVRIYEKNAPRDAKKILTRYKTLASENGFSLLEVELLTGRTHQIRAHMAHIGHPLRGDGKYGINRADRADGYKYQALWSYRLRFAPTEEKNLLSYLDGKEFSVPFDKIYFLKDFSTIV